MPAQFCPSQRPNTASRTPQGRIGERDVTMQATKAAEQSQDSRYQDSRYQNNDLDNRYGKIGISAVAAALCHQGEQHNVTEIRSILYDRG